MKKVVLSLAVLFSIAMVSCGGNKATEATDSDTLVAVEETVTDTVVPVEDSTVAVEGDTTVAVAVETPAEAK